ncbi:hypothetical protein [Magnetofaba australis]|uniref:Uncharacterized protein n=1 Tax=Magnetofaba australis IT-1 TaxID=1434232 RepID=A0A1Y2KA01_9PROT|nr:hypothetical protein [Magnetofaba australis]OSM08485.1 hypothetical protein MAIT1_04658 [Magnetofaba australis IT-1]
MMDQPEVDATAAFQGFHDAAKTAAERVWWSKIMPLAVEMGCMPPTLLSVRRGEYLAKGFAQVLGKEFQEQSRRLGSDDEIEAHEAALRIREIVSAIGVLITAGQQCQGKGAAKD